MCGRYAASADVEELVELFEVDEVPQPLPAPSWNVAPTDVVPAVVERSGEAGVDRKLVGLRWGLVPSWSKDPRGGARMINARFETVAEKPAFRKAFRTRRCLLPADGYFEWYAEPAADPGTKSSGRPTKQPFFIHRTDSAPLVMAGIYEFWRDDDKPADHPDAWISSCSIITTRATDALGRIHDRMPMVIGSEVWSDWLDPALTDPARALELLAVTQADQLDAYPVSKAVGKVSNNGPELVQPL